MKNLSTHGTASQFAAASALITIALLAAPLFAADETQVIAITNLSDANHLVAVFQKTGAEAFDTFGNRSIDDTGFDFAAYMNNTCFRPTENDKTACEREFGAYANLQKAYESGQLHMILNTVPYLSDAAKFAPAPMAVIEASSSSSRPAQEVILITPDQETVRERSEMLWDTCDKLHLNFADTVRCYQRNIRRTQSGNERATADNVY